MLRSAMIANVRIFQAKFTKNHLLEFMLSEM